MNDPAGCLELHCPVKADTPARAVSTRAAVFLLAKIPFTYLDAKPRPILNEHRTKAAFDDMLLH